jgi:hypothetical protein
MVARSAALWGWEVCATLGAEDVAAGAEHPASSASVNSTVMHNAKPFFMFRSPAFLL